MQKRLRQQWKFLWQLKEDKNINEAINLVVPHKKNKYYEMFANW